MLKVGSTVKRHNIINKYIYRMGAHNTPNFKCLLRFVYNKEKEKKKKKNLRIYFALYGTLKIKIKNLVRYRLTVGGVGPRRFRKQ